MRETTWSRIGTDVSEATTLEEVLEKAKLNYNVIKAPIYTMKNGQLAEYKDKVGEIIIGYKFVITGDTNTSSNMSANGSMNGTVTCTHSTENDLVQVMYPGEAVYNNLQIKGGAAGGGSYGVTTRDLNGKEINKADVDWQVGEEIHK